MLMFGLSDRYRQERARIAFISPALRSYSRTSVILNSGGNSGQCGVAYGEVWNEGRELVHGIKKIELQGARESARGGI